MKKILRHRMKNYNINIQQIILVILVSIPFIMEGIIHNDDIRTIMDFTNNEFIKAEWQGSLGQGRVFRLIVVTWLRALSFLTINLTSNLIIGKLLVLICIFLEIFVMSKLAYVLFHDKLLSYIYAFFTFLLLPISFEPCAPNAFTLDFGGPYIAMIVSLLFYSKFINEVRRKKNLLISIGLLGIGLLSYEAYFAWPLLFACITIDAVLNQRVQWKEGMKYLGITWGGTLVFLLIYIGARAIFPSEYVGNQMVLDWNAISAAFCKLFASGIPGNLYFKKKYLGYLYAYSKEIFSQPIYWIAFVAIGYFIILQMKKFMIRNSQDKFKAFIENKKRIKTSLIVAFIIGTICLAISPYSFTSLYQKNLLLGDKGWSASVVSHYTYYMFMLLLTAVFRYLMQRKYLKWLVGLGMWMLVMATQFMNYTISYETKNVYDRVQNMQHVLNTDVIQAYEGNVFSSLDFFEERHTLGIADDVWNRYLKGKDVDIQINNKQVNNQNEYYIEYPNDMYFIVGDKKQFSLLSEKWIEGSRIPVKCGDYDLFKEYELKNAILDHGFYVYNFKIIDGEIGSIELLNSKHLVFENLNLQRLIMLLKNYIGM